MTPLKLFLTSIKGYKALYLRPLTDRYQTLSGLMRADFPQLVDMCGEIFAGHLYTIISGARAAQCEAPPVKDMIVSPEDASAYFHPRLVHLQVEEVHAAYLDAANSIIISERIQCGTVDQSVVYPREVMRRAILHNASGFILAHNHPGGSVDPSTQDRQLTDLLYQASKPLGIRFLDHVIIGYKHTAGFSFRYNGLMST